MSKNNESKITIYATIIAVSLSIGAALVGVAEWIDSRYSKNEQFTAVTYNLIVTTYNERIADKNDRLNYLLEFEPTNKDEIRNIRERKDDIKRQRDYFLAEGHVKIGDYIILNKSRVINKFPIN